MTNTDNINITNHTTAAIMESIEQSKSNEPCVNRIIARKEDHHPVTGPLDEVLTLQNYIWQMNICNHI